MNTPIHTLRMRVRDYELDSEGIVNNANYLHYLEVARHDFCEQAGMSFKQMSAQGLIPVLSRVEIDYKTPLRSGDTMECRLWVEMRGPRFVFHQDIISVDSQALAVSAVVSVVCLKDGRLSRGEEFAEFFKDYLR